MIRNFKTTGFTNPEVSSSLSPRCAVFVTSLYGCVQTQVNLFSDGLVRVNPVDNGEMVCYVCAHDPSCAHYIRASFGTSAKRKAQPWKHLGKCLWLPVCDWEGSNVWLAGYQHHTCKFAPSVVSEIKVMKKAQLELKKAQEALQRAKTGRSLHTHLALLPISEIVR